MRTKSWSKDMPEINTKGIDSIKGKYLRKISESSLETLSLVKAEQLFRFVVKDFKKGVLSSDELADFGFKIFHGIAKKYPKSDLFQASLSASELTFEMRSKGERVRECLDDINKFYEPGK